MKLVMLRAGKVEVRLQLVQLEGEAAQVKQVVLHATQTRLTFE